MPETSLRQAGARLPKYSCQHSKVGSDRVVVRINGKRVCLGAYRSLKSRQRYAELIGRQIPQAPVEETSISKADPHER